LVHLVKAIAKLDKCQNGQVALDPHILKKLLSFTGSLNTG